MSFRAGSTFILTRATGTSPHLWVVLWGPAGPADAYLIVHLASRKPHSDATVVLRAGEHPFIQHETCAVFSDARRTTAEKLGQAAVSRQLHPRADASPEMLEKLRAALFLSARTPHAIRDLAVREFGAVPPASQR
jgi:hypothetical protein